jgi:hypothetical protein
VGWPTPTSSCSSPTPPTTATPTRCARPRGRSRAPGSSTGGDQRTVGTYLRTDELVEGAALMLAVARVSEALAARIEVQFREEILGYLVDGRPDAALAAALPVGDIPDSP